MPKLIARRPALGLLSVVLASATHSRALEVEVAIRVTALVYAMLQLNTILLRPAAVALLAVAPARPSSRAQCLPPLAPVLGCGDAGDAWHGLR
jgi:hypothetical protein